MRETWFPPCWEHTSGVGDLFSDAASARLSDVAPLAMRLRPSTLDEFVGQEQVLGEGSALRLAIAEDRVGSMILYGPPGSGKTTLARIVANTTGAHFEELSAVSATVKDVREVLAAARGGSVRAASGRSCSWTRSTASTRRSRMRFCPRSRKGS